MKYRPQCPPKLVPNKHDRLFGVSYFNDLSKLFLAVQHKFPSYTSSFWPFVRTEA